MGGEHPALRRVVGSDCFDLILDQLKAQGSAHDFKSVCRHFRDAIHAYEAEHGRIRTPLAALVGRGNDLLSRPKYYQEMFTTGSMVPPRSCYDGLWNLDAAEEQNLGPDVAVMCAAAELGNAELLRTMWSHNWSGDASYCEPMSLFGPGGQFASPFRSAMYHGIAAGHVDILRVAMRIRLRNSDGSAWRDWVYDALVGASAAMVHLMHQHDLLPPYVGHPSDRDDEEEERTIAVMLRTGASVEALDFVHSIHGRYAAGRCDIHAACAASGLRPLQWLLGKLTLVHRSYLELGMRVAGHPDVVWFLLDQKNVLPTASNVQMCIDAGADVDFLRRMAQRGVFPDDRSLYSALQTARPEVIEFVLDHSTTPVTEATVGADDPSDEGTPLTCAHAFVDGVSPSREIVDMLRDHGVPWGKFCKRALQAWDFELYRYARDHCACAFDWKSSAELFVKAGAPKCILSGEDSFVEFLEKFALRRAWEVVAIGELFGFGNVEGVV